MSRIKNGVLIIKRGDHPETVMGRADEVSTPSQDPLRPLVTVQLPGKPVQNLTRGEILTAIREWYVDEDEENYM